MGSLAPTFGVPRVQLSTFDRATSLDDLNSFSDVNVSVITPTVIKKNSPKVPLAGDYKVKVVEVGYDVTNLGFTFGKATANESSAHTVTAGQGILVNIANDDFATYMGKSIAIGIFLQKGVGDYRLASLGYMDADNDFAYCLTGEAMLDAFNASDTILDSNTAGETGGSRKPCGVAYGKRFRTVGGVRIRHRMESTKVDQDDAPAYDVPVARAADIEFSVLSNNLDDLMQLSAGDYTKFTDLDSSVVEQGDSEIQAIVSQLTGNKALKVLYPPNKLGRQVTKLFMGNVDVSNAEWVEDYKKLEQFKLDQKLVGAPIDDLIGSVGTGISYVRYAA